MRTWASSGAGTWGAPSFPHSPSTRSFPAHSLIRLPYARSLSIPSFSLSPFARPLSPFARGLALRQPRQSAKRRQSSAACAATRAEAKARRHSARRRSAARSPQASAAKRAARTAGPKSSRVRPRCAKPAKEALLVMAKMANAHLSDPAAVLVRLDSNMDPAMSRAQPKMKLESIDCPPRCHGHGGK